MILSDMVQLYLNEKQLGLRGTAKNIGCDYTTLWRFLKGKTIEDRPLVKILMWTLSEESSSPCKSKITPRA